jgi:hypothetical protein
LETQRCPYCREEIPAESTMCPVCYTDLTLPPPGMQHSSPQRPAPQAPIYQTGPYQSQQQTQYSSRPMRTVYEPPVAVGVKWLLYLLSIFATSLVGIIAGSIYKSHANPVNRKFGRTLFNWSIAFLLIRGICILANVFDPYMFNPPPPYW